jgi:hypothetical protein
MAQEYAADGRPGEEEVYRHYAPRVFAYLLRHVPTRQDFVHGLRSGEIADHLAKSENAVRVKPQTGTVHVTFFRAYADRSRLILVYKINSVPTPAISWSGFFTLSTQQGDLNTSSGSSGTGYQVQSFDTSNLPTSTTTLQVYEAKRTRARSGARSLRFESTGGAMY